MRMTPKYDRMRGTRPTLRRTIVAMTKSRFSGYFFSAMRTMPPARRTVKER